ncbi:MAG: METTL5 family protein [Thermoplasmatota archaeon]
MTGIKKKHLEIKLEDIPPHPDPKQELEQYPTPSPIATDILYSAFLNRDILDKKVIDFGCGTGIFSLGAALLGAKQVVAVDLDKDAVKIAKDFAERWDLDDKIEYKVMDVENFSGRGDTVLMNPPFGSQKRGADIPFLNQAFKSARKIYSLHNEKTEDYIRNHIKNKGFHIFWEKRYMFGIDRIFDFHRNESKNINVILFGVKKLNNIY